MASTGSRHGCLGKWQSRMSRGRLLDQHESRGDLGCGEGGVKTMGGEEVRSAGERRRLGTLESGVVARPCEVWPRRWRIDVPPNHAVQRTPGARHCVVKQPAVGGAPGAADGERSADKGFRVKSL